MSLASQVGHSLEHGRKRTLMLASSAWGALAARTLVTPLAFGVGRRVIVVGSSTLGGSATTPLAIECAKFLASLGEAVAFVGHARGAQPQEALVVSSRDHLSRVGDDALVAAQALGPYRVPVVVAPTRQAALDRALDCATVAVVDGVNQTGPVRAHLSLLAVDATRPWGSGSCRPRGDLRAPRAALASACDRIVAVGDDSSVSYDLTWADRPIHQVRVVSDGVWVGGKLLDWGQVRKRRVGLWTSVARPDRITQQLATLRVTPRLVVESPETEVMSTAETTGRARRAAEAAIDLWLCTARCAVRLPPQLDGVPLGVIDYRLRLGDGLTHALRAVASGTAESDPGATTLG